jgi:hypothetical protein
MPRDIMPERTAGLRPIVAAERHFTAEQSLTERRLAEALAAGTQQRLMAGAASTAVVMPGAADMVAADADRSRLAED